MFSLALHLTLSPCLLQKTTNPLPLATTRTLRTLNPPVTGKIGYAQLSGPPWYWSQEKSTPACLPNETDVGGHGTRKWQPWVFGLENGDSVWIKWVDKPLQAKTKTPGTPISYLTSMQMFLTYLTRQKHDPRVHVTAFRHPQANLLGAYPGIKRMESL